MLISFDSECVLWNYMSLSSPIHSKSQQHLNPIRFIDKREELQEVLKKHPLIHCHTKSFTLSGTRLNLLFLLSVAYRDTTDIVTWNYITLLLHKRGRCSFSTHPVNVLALFLSLAQSVWCSMRHIACCFCFYLNFSCGFRYSTVLTTHPQP